LTDGVWDWVSVNSFVNTPNHEAARKINDYEGGRFRPLRMCTLEFARRREPEDIGGYRSMCDVVFHPRGGGPRYDGTVDVVIYL
jgi:hypothetical protein